MTEPLDHHAALIYAMVTMSAALVMVGGELTLDPLELAYNPVSGFYRAPVQAIANGERGEIGQAGEFEQIAALLPPAVRAILGPSLTSVMSFNGIVCGGFFDLGNVLVTFDVGRMCRQVGEAVGLEPAVIYEALFDARLLRVRSNDGQKEKAEISGHRGMFLTERIPPGTYEVHAGGYAPLTPEQERRTGIIRPTLTMGLVML